MNTKTALCVAIALNMASGNPAFAQLVDRGNGVPVDERQKDQELREQLRLTSPGYRYEDPGYGRHSWSNNRHDRYPDGSHRWQRGDRLPPEYRDRQYVVNDWRGHQLNAPPRGYQWVQSGSDYLLVAIATGIIAQLLMNR